MIFRLHFFAWIDLTFTYLFEVKSKGNKKKVILQTCDS